MPTLDPKDWNKEVFSFFLLLSSSPTTLPAYIMDRHFTVAVFIVYQNKTLLHWHKKLEVWLPVGGHVDPNESLCEAAIREAREESGLEIELHRLHPPLMENERHVQNLISPIHMQNERIGEGHEHLDAIYYARASSDALHPMEGETMKIGWYTEEELETLPLLPDVKLFAKEALTLLRT